MKYKSSTWCLSVIYWLIPFPKGFYSFIYHCVFLVWWSLHKYKVVVVRDTGRAHCGFCSLWAHVYYLELIPTQWIHKSILVAYALMGLSYLGQPHLHPPLSLSVSFVSEFERVHGSAWEPELWRESKGDVSRIVYVSILFSFLEIMSSINTSYVVVIWC